MFETKWLSKYYMAKFVGYRTKAILQDKLIALNKYIREHKILEIKWAKYLTWKIRREEGGGREEEKDNKSNKVEERNLYVTQKLLYKKQKGIENINKTTS